MVDFEFKSSYNFYDLVNIMSILRSPDGCPWDREQSHKSIRRDFLEECYEAIEAIDTDDKELLEEELGDVLLQVVFHAQIEAEAGSFNADDVCDGICKKLIIRHPHVFGEVEADTSEEVLKNWDAIKMQTKSQQTLSEVMHSVSPAMPALIRADKIQNKARKVGFDFPDVNTALGKLEEEIAELKAAIADGAKDEIMGEIGDVLFSAVNVSRLLKIDSEKALSDTSEKFISRFEDMEKLCKERDIDINSLSLTELDKLWDEVKSSN
ncbi:MAG: nucleoside triphosphate pyrophosphohydrolase [Ruminococcaceae bacterium]|nr:nucleoside triphosphate pyrophosphohydrolase [Oscillospiraceae bacterium]